jgi:hypothetical protein
MFINAQFFHFPCRFFHLLDVQSTILDSINKGIQFEDGKRVGQNVVEAPEKEIQILETIEQLVQRADRENRRDPWWLRPREGMTNTSEYRFLTVLRGLIA